MNFFHSAYISLLIHIKERMVALKRTAKKLFSLDGMIQVVFALLIISIPMQYRFHKVLRPFAEVASKEGVEIPVFFERIVFYCISDVFILLLLAALICKKAISLKSFFTQQSSKYLSAYFLVALMSLILSKNNDYILQYIRWWQLMWAGMIFYILSGGLITTDLRSLLRKFMTLTVITAVFESGIAITQYFTQHALGLKKLGEINFSSPECAPSSFRMHDGSLWIFDHLFSDPGKTEFITRAYGTLPDPNILGGYLVFSLLASCYLFMVSSKKSRIWLTCAMFAQFFSLFITYSRSAFLGVILGAAVFFSFDCLRCFLERRKETKSMSLSNCFSCKFLILVMLGCFTACMLLFYPQLLERGGYVNYKNTLAQDADHERIVYQEIAANIIEQHPLTGVGFNNYVLEMKEHSQQELPYFYSHPVHNIFLLVASETGLLGLASFCMFIFTTTWAMLKKGLTNETILLGSIMVAFLFISCCSHYFLTWQPGKLMFFTVFGLIGLAGRKERSPSLAIKENYSRVTI